MTTLASRTTDRDLTDGNSTNGNPTAGDPIDGDSLTPRDRAILRAVAGGTAELVFGAEPDLIIDGRCCCDQPAAHRLARAGLIAPLSAAVVGERVRAGLTPAGTARLSA